MAFRASSCRFSLASTFSKFYCFICSRWLTLVPLTFAILFFSAWMDCRLIRTAGCGFFSCAY